MGEWVTCMFGDGVVKFCNRLAKASGLGVGIFGAVVFSSGGIASSALGQRQLTLLLDRMILRMSIRLS